MRDFEKIIYVDWNLERSTCYFQELAFEVTILYDLFAMGKVIVKLYGVLVFYAITL